jgi:O-antigen/teichoic acid export membrane protein
MSATIVTAVLGFVQGIVVARFLEPAEYGLVAAAFVVVGLGRAVADGGLSAAVIARNLNRETLSSLFWFNQASGLAIAALALLSAPLVADFFGAPGVAEVVRWAALLFVVAPAGAQFGQLLHRELAFRRLAVQQVLPSVLGTAVAIAAAASGAGAVSIVWGMLVTTTVGTAMLVRVGWQRWPPVHGFDWRRIRPHLGFGAYQMGERALTFAGSNVDYVLIGRFLGAGPLGSYSLAYQLVVRPVFVINPVVTRVAFPIFARRQDDDGALRRGYLQVVRVVAYVTLPLLAGLALVAPDFVPVVLGPQWVPSVPVMQILCLLGVLRCLANPVGTVLLAKDRPDLGFKGNLVSFVVMAVALAVAVQHGLLVTAWTEVGVTAIFWTVWLLVLRRLIGIRWSGYASELAVPVLLTAVMAGILLVLRLLLGDVSAAVRLVTLVASGAAVYLAGALLLDRVWLRGVWRLLRGPSDAVAPGAA